MQEKKRDQGVVQKYGTDYWGKSFWRLYLEVGMSSFFQFPLKLYKMKSHSCLYYLVVS